MRRCEPAKIFPWFVEQLTEARRTGDVDKSKALLAEVFKLLGNSAYGKLIEALERQKNTIYTKDEKAVDKALRSTYFSDLNEIGHAYELESRKPRITIRRPFQVGIVVYQLAKLRMLEFYYNFLDRYFVRRDFQLIQMDTDGNYMASSAESVEDIVRPELKAEFEAQKKCWLAWDKWSGRTPGLFKLECVGSRMIALCSKCYFVDEPEGEKKKFSMKGMSKKQNEIKWERFQGGLARQQGYGNQQRYQDVERADGHLRAAEARAERLLRQAVGAGRWGYTPNQSNFTFSSRQPEEEWCLEGQPAVLHTRSHAWDRHANSRERVDSVW